MSLVQLLGDAAHAGAEELRLAPGQRAVQLRRGTASPVGEVQSEAAIDDFVEPLLTAEARMDLALGSAEWGACIAGLGDVLVRAELKNGATHVAFLLDELRSSMPAVFAGSITPARSLGDGPAELGEDAAELSELDFEADEAALMPSGALSLSPMPPLAAARAPAMGRAPAVGARPSAIQVSESLPPSLGVPRAAPAPVRGSPQSESAAQVAPAAQPAAPVKLVQNAVAVQPASPAKPPQAGAPGQSAPAAQPAPAASKERPAEKPRSASEPERPGAEGARAVVMAGAQLPPSGEIHQLLVATIRARGSDLHLSSGVLPMVRIDGDLRPMTVRGPLTSAAIEELVWPLVPERARADFGRRKDADFGVEIAGTGRFRGNLFVDRNGMGAVFRVIPTQIVPAERLGLPQEVLRLCHLPKGLVLVTGPTGSGKSTTLASLIDYINRSRSAHIIAIEDPIEFVFENKKCLVNQREVGTHTGSFRDALRAALREDPDVLFIGEMRDLETIEIALETAETGHLVFATLHTSSAPATVDRIIDQFPAERQNQIRVMLAESLKGVIAQMLCRRTNGGRVAAFEVLFGIPAVAHLIREKKVHQMLSVMQTGGKIGMRVMNDSLVDLVKRNVVAQDEALSKTQDRAGLLAALREANFEP